MLNRKRNLVCFAGFLIFLIFISFIPTSSVIDYSSEDNLRGPQAAVSLDAYEGIVITKIDREANISGYGLLSILDIIDVYNGNDNPITSIYIGIPSNHSSDLVFFEARGSDKETLVVERGHMKIGVYEMIAIYFSSPLLPGKKDTIQFLQTYKDWIGFVGGGGAQYLNFSGPVYPLLPYKATGDITASYKFPDSSSSVSTDWGAPDSDDRNTIIFDFDDLQKIIDDDYIDPMMENIENSKDITLIFTETTLSKLEVIKIDRDIHISPWGIIKVKEEFLIQNKGYIDITNLKLKIPGASKSVLISDYLGEVLGTSFSPVENYTHLEYRDVFIDLSKNRVRVTPNSKVRFTLEYDLIFDRFYSANWLQESIKIDLLTSKYEFLGRDQTIQIFVEGAYNIDSITAPPNKITRSQEAIILIYENDFVSPHERKLIQFTFSINVLDMLLRPIVIALLIAIISSAFVLIVKSREDDKTMGIIKKEFVPVNEIREFCSLNEEKNALFFEIRQSEEHVKRKKIGKKVYRNILTKNNAKIEKIEEEVMPFKKILSDANLAFKNIINKLDVLEAERISVKDSIKLLETRYKRGKLPSPAAYQKLLDNFMRRRNKIDRTIDKQIQHLRTYLL